MRDRRAELREAGASPAADEGDHPALLCGSGQLENCAAERQRPAGELVGDLREPRTQRVRGADRGREPERRPGGSELPPGASARPGFPLRVLSFGDGRRRRYALPALFRGGRSRDNHRLSAADRLLLGDRPLGTGSPHRRGQSGGRPGEPGGSRVGPLERAVPAGPGVLPVAHDRRPEKGSRRNDRWVSGRRSI